MCRRRDGEARQARDAVLLAAKEKKVRKWLAWGVRRGVQRGLIEGNQFWLVLGALAYLGQLGLRVSRKRRETMFAGQVAIGEDLIVVHRERERNKGSRSKGPW